MNGKGSVESFKVRLEKVENIPVICVEGDMTSQAEEPVMSAFEKARKESQLRYLLFNFEKTNYVNSAGIGVLINIIEILSKENGKVGFASLSDHLRKVLDIVGLSDMADIFDTIEEAVNKIPQST